LKRGLRTSEVSFEKSKQDGLNCPSCFLFVIARHGLNGFELQCGDFSIRVNGNPSFSAIPLASQAGAIRRKPRKVRLKVVAGIGLPAIVFLDSYA
jgi:hypothetical protein